MAAAYGTVSPAHADTLKTENFASTAESAGLLLKLGGSSLTLGSAKSFVDGALAPAKNLLSAKAEGAGQLLSASSVSTQAPTIAGLLTDSKPQACVANLPLAGLLNVSLACGISSSTVASDMPIARALGHVADVRVLGDGPLGQLLAALNINDLAATLQGLVGGGASPTAAATDTALLGGLLGSLGAVNQLLPSLPLVGDTLNTLLGLLNTNTLSSLVPDPVVITVGDSTSLIQTDASKIISKATSSGVDIKVLPVAAIPALANGLVHIVIGEAGTTATFDRLAGTSSAKYDVANLLRLDVLGVSIPVAPNLDLTVPGILALKLGKGSVETLADRAGATAVGASLDVLNGLVQLRLADASSSIGGKLASVTTPVPVPLKVEAARQLPRTGPGSPLIPILGVSVLALAVVGRRMVLRTR
jgi:hypothetical protein